MVSDLVLPTGELVDVADLPDAVRQQQSLLIASEHVRPLRDMVERHHRNRTLTTEQFEIGLPLCSRS